MKQIITAAHTAWLSCHMVAGAAEESPALPVPPQDAPGGAAFANENIVHDDGTGAQISFFLPTHDKRGSLEVEYTSYNIIVVKNGRFLLLEDLSGSKTEDSKAFFGKIIIPSEFIDSAEIGMWGSPRSASPGIEKKLKVSTFKRITREKSWTEQKSATEGGAIRLESNRDAATAISRIRAVIKADLTFDKLSEILGEPDMDIGSGIHIFVYRLSDGTGITVGTPDKKKVMYIEHTGKRLFPIEGKQAAGTVIRRGDNIGEHLQEASPLRKYGDGKSLLDTPAGVPFVSEVAMWKVGDGILIIEHSFSAGIIMNISYVIMNGKDKERTTIQVKEFNPTTGEMIIVVPFYEIHR